MYRGIVFISCASCALAVALFAAPRHVQSKPTPDPDPAADPKGRDSVLDWNAVAIQACADDHSHIYGDPDQGGPTRASRALAIVHAAMYDAANSVHPDHKRYLAFQHMEKASLDAAVATAAYETLVVLYPHQASVFDDLYADYLAPIKAGESRKDGIKIGQYVAKKILKARKNDGSNVMMDYEPSGLPGRHGVDPLNPNQGFLSPLWGDVTPFGIDKHFSVAIPPPPAMGSPEYAAAWNDVFLLGGDGDGTPTLRTDEQTEIGLYWAYDGARGLGVPPRLYNQIVRVIAVQQENSELENARLFALVNIAMADAGIVCWKNKYVYDYWRPILGIRHADEDGNPDTAADPDWSPLGAPASNQSGNNFTPPFPSYASGHATFGAAVFRILALYYETDEVPFTFVSDELNGVTTDSTGLVVRPYSPRSFATLSQAAQENARSRIYLGIHWQFDADEGVHCGVHVADSVFENVLR